MKSKNLFLLVFLLILTLVSAQITSPNYNINSIVVSNGGTNVTSTNYKTDATVGDIIGNISSNSYKEFLGFWYTIKNNLAPIQPTPILNSSTGNNLTTDNLTCYALLNDPNGYNINVSVKWYKNGTMNLSLDHNNSYPNSTLFNSTLLHGNTTKLDNWSCSIRLYNGFLWSTWGNSSNLTILNSLPTVTLTAPTDWNATTNRSPEFSWVGYDADGDNLTYEFNLTVDQFSGFASCSDDRLITGLTNTSYIPTGDLKCLYDNGFYYNWSVRARDNSGYGNWSSIYHLNVTAQVSITLNSTNMLFGQLAIGGENDTTDNSPPPFIINNSGNVLTNVSVNSTAIWNSKSDNSSYYQFKANNVTGEGGAFNWLGSIVSWFNMPINANVVAIDKLNYSVNNNSAKVDIRLQVPPNEAPGSKSAMTIFTAQLAE